MAGIATRSPSLPKLEPEDTLVPLDLRVGSWYLNVDGRPCHVHSMGKQPNRFKVHVFDEMHGRVLKTSWHDANGAPASGNPGGRIAVMLTDEGVPLPRVRREQEAKPAGEWDPWNGWKCVDGAAEEVIGLMVGEHYISADGDFCTVERELDKDTFRVKYAESPRHKPYDQWNVRTDGHWLGHLRKHDLVKRCDSQGVFTYGTLAKSRCGAVPEEKKLDLKVGQVYAVRCGEYGHVIRHDPSDDTFLVGYNHDPADDRDHHHLWIHSDGAAQRSCKSDRDLIALYTPPAKAPAKLTPEVGKVYRTRDGNYGLVMSHDYNDNTISVRYQHRPDDTDGMYLWIKDTGRLGSKDDHRDLISLHDFHPAPSKAPMPTPTQETTASALLSLLGDMNRSVVAGIVKEQLENAGTRGKFMDDLKEPLSKIVGDTVKAAVTHQLAAMGTREITVRLADHVVTVTSPHPKLEEAINISQAINNVWLCGPAGSGKTTLAHQLADALNLQFGFVSCTTGMSESKLLGRMNVQGTYLPAEFVRIYEEGGVFLWDEFDAADPNVVLCANSAMANGHLAVPDRVDRPVATRHKDTILVIATNTWGRGSTSEYTARETLDAATRDRFVLSKIHVDYAPAIEYQYLGAYEPAWVTPTEINTGRKLQDVLVKIRANIEKHHLRRVLSTRVFAQAAALRKIGWSDGQILSRYFLDWTEQERVKALEGAL